MGILEQNYRVPCCIDQILARGVRTELASLRLVVEDVVQTIRIAVGAICRPSAGVVWRVPLHSVPSDVLRANNELVAGGLSTRSRACDTRESVPNNRGKTHGTYRLDERARSSRVPVRPERGKHTLHEEGVLHIKP